MTITSRVISHVEEGRLEVCFLDLMIHLLGIERRATSKESLDQDGVLAQVDQEHIQGPAANALDLV